MKVAQSAFRGVTAFLFSLISFASPVAHRSHWLLFSIRPWPCFVSAAQNVESLGVQRIIVTRSPDPCDMLKTASSSHIALSALQRGAQRGSRNITKAVDSVLNLPARATQMDTSVHGQPVAGIVSAPEGTEVPTLLRSNTVLMQKVGRACSCFPPVQTIRHHLVQGHMRVWRSSHNTSGCIHLVSQRQFICP